ncbi:hypothetical protein [Ruminococcus flavefaciens]|uniref:hypothetical protein n=1 Tax=Ruminococcus flavefaciens TaxID=1265 RepID=UPI000464A1CA|nr:hypothetical protein [Ruminococcus flavefaciens]
MSYCKNCGKKVPLFKKCDCTVTEKTANNGLKRGFALIVFLVFFIIGLILGLNLAGFGTKGTVKKYVKAASNKKGGKEFYSLTMPDEAIKALKDMDKYDDKVDAYNDMIKDMIKDMEKKETVPKFDKILREKKLKNVDLRNAEDYLEKIAEKYGAESPEIKVSRGTEVRFRTKKKDEYGDYKHEKITVCVVNVKGEGRKIIPMGADALG